MPTSDTRSPRYTLRFTIAALVAGLLVLTVGGTVVIALLTRARTRDAITHALANQASARVAQALEARLEPAETLVRESLHAARRGQLSVDDSVALALDLAERIRFDERFESLAFVGEDGSAAGGVRLPDGRLLVVHGEPNADGEMERVDAVLHEDGTREEIGRVLHGVSALREAPWYALGAASEEPIWTPPYIRPFDGQRGRACAAAFRRDGETVGVFGVGFSLSFLQGLLARVPVGETGCVFALDPETGALRVGPSTEQTERLGPSVANAVSQIEGGIARLQPGEVAVTVVDHEGESLLVALAPQHFRETVRWTNAIVVPEDEAIGFLNRYVVPGMLGILALLAVGVYLAMRLARRIARPLRAIAEDLERVAAFDLTPDPSPQSRIAEVTVVGDATDRMKAGLRSFSRYVPTDLVRTVLAEGQEARLGGSVRPLTLFFSDVKGFTSLSEAMETEPLVASLGEYLDAVTRTVLEAGGTIDKFMGDGVLAFFNAPQDDADHAKHACDAALRVQAALEAEREGWSARGWPPFFTRIGLHTASVVVGNLGTPDRFAYTVIGDGVNLAARLESLNKAYGTWILGSEEVRAQAGEGFVWRELDRTAVAGRAEGGAVFELLGRDGEVDESMLAARDAYETALGAYLARDFGAALVGFERALAQRAGDVAAATLAERARSYAASPPPSDWNGVHVQTSK